MRYYAASLAALHGADVATHVLFFRAEDFKTACLYAHGQLLNEYPVAEGWSKHTMSVRDMGELHEELRKREGLINTGR